jgi:hypothetical protein
MAGHLGGGMNQSIPRDSQHVPATVAKCQVCRGIEVEDLSRLYQIRYTLTAVRRDKLNTEPVPARRDHAYTAYAPTGQRAGQLPDH